MNEQTRLAWWVVGLIFIVLVAQVNPQLAGFAVIAITLFLGFTAAQKGLI